MKGGLLAWVFVGGLLAQVNPNMEALEDFTKLINDYGKTKKIAEAEIHGLRPTNSPEEIEHHEKRLAHSIRESRRTARQGDIFKPAIAAAFRRLISQTMNGPEGAAIRQSLRSGSPPSVRTLHVNEPYPAGEPLQSTPPSLLANLPQLPQGLDYRVVGQALVLRDSEANLIIDFLPNAIS